MKKTLVAEDGSPARVKMAGKESHLYSDHLPVELIVPGATVKAACRAITNPKGSGDIHV